MCGKRQSDQAPGRSRTGIAGSGRNWSGPFRKTPGRLFGMAAIRAYQLTLSSFIGNSCRHLPTCSEYGYEAIGRHGLWTGGWLTLFRVVRCGPGGTHGFDPVPEMLAPRQRWYAPWRFWRRRRKDA
ncbi:membrane protein insertion efficiency factor YidD [Sinorhizobium fredii]|uniref:Putative membrane protein insertion efficiency factor n=1 Tax=Rhizobium fredii TaxID=380 RepID=A0A2A6LV01_RHIFR|nr:membrane protein insertion efficiency factor YidD [Sinorhizobium fredii]ASY68589.1 protein YidD [Sinorhizobium fredii CCBAU 83666]PDT46188.1 membrane protein insertion efficiency factor YidD [Sinorhizobium fredii]